MLKDLHTLTPYLDFIRTCNADPDYRDPMLLTQQQLHRNLLDAPENPNTRVFGTFEGEAITGVFALLVLEDERYLELLAGLFPKRGSICRTALTSEIGPPRLSGGFCL